MKLRKCLIIGASVLGVVCLVIVAVWALAPGPEFTLNMYATIISGDNGTKQESTLTITGEVPAGDGDVLEFPAQLEMGPGSRYLFGDSETPHSVRKNRFAQYPELKDLLLFDEMIYDSDTNAPVFARIALDLNTKQILIYVEGTKDIIVASTKEDIPPEDIITHFQAAIEFFTK